ncbi:MAG: hypothetical protein NC337_12690 [Roseburia sp.]|nr:hypothetical protein [Roseburia sp.]
MILRDYWGEIKRGIGLVIMGGLLGWVLLVVAYLLPIDPIERHVKEALETLSEMGPAPRLIQDNPTTRLDMYTDSIMLNEAVYKGTESIWERAVAGYEYIYEGETPFQSLLAYLSGEAGAEGMEYARYWHGYLIFLKPLLIFFSYGDIKGINLLIQIFLLGTVIMEMAKRGMRMYIYAFLLGVYSLMPLAITMCIDYSVIFNIMLVSCVILLKYYEKLVDKKYVNLFYVVVGMSVCYFDFLTYPLVVLGFVLLMHIILECDNKKMTGLKIVRNIAERTLFWGGGYVGIWGIKWVLASIFMRKNIIKEAILQVLYRSSTEVSDSGITEETSRIQALGINLKTIIVSPLVIALAVFLCLILVKCLKKKRLSFDSARTWGMVIVAIMPFVWVMFKANHAYVHYWMVYREFSTTVFAMASVMLSLIGTDG